MVGNKKKKSAARATQGRGQFYRGRTTQTSADKKRLKKQKEYRRAKLSKQKRQELIQRAQGVGRWVLAAGLLFLLFNVLQIKSHQYVGLTGLTDADKQVITTLTNSYIGGTQRFKTFFNGEDFANYITENASFVSAVETSTSPFSTTLKIRIVPKEAAHAYQIDPSVTSDRWVAQDGSIIRLTEAQLGEMGQETPTTAIVDRTGVDYDEGDVFTSVATLDFIRLLTLELKLAEYEVDLIEFGENPRELRIGLVGEKYDLLVSLERSIASTVIDLEAAQAEITKAKKPINEYIDLRVIDKVFYR